MTLAVVIFVLTYAIIVSERVHRTVAAMLGATALLLLRVLPQEEAFHAIDFNVIFLLVGMMAMTDLMRKTGVFQWTALRSVKLTRGDPFRLMLALCTLTAVASALLDNVTVVVLVAPLTLFIADSLAIRPTPFLIAEILASNIGGTATLIGDPPNLLIGSAAGLDFNAFLIHLAPVSILILIVFLVLIRFVFGGSFKVSPALQARVMALDERALITDAALLRKSLLVISLTMLGFLLHGPLGLEPATIALSGATLLLLWSRHDPAEVLREVEWTTLFFFVGLFIVVEGLVKVGAIRQASEAVMQLTRGNLTLTAIALLWMSAVLSGIVDNIPYTAAMIPVVKQLGASMPAQPLWWSLALGACLGGNLTLIGASANVVIASIAERSGHPISFGEFLRYGALVTLISMVIATAYVWVRYL